MIDLSEGVAWRLALFCLAAALVAMALMMGKARKRAAANEAIAERRLHEARQAASQLSLLIDGASTYAIYMLDPEGRVTVWNKGAERIKGWREDEVLGRDAQMFYLPEDVAADVPHEELREAARLGRLEVTSWRLRKDGSRFLARITVSPLYDEKGVLIGFGKVLQDITEKSVSDAAIETREVQLRSILATVPDAMVVIDEHGIIRSFSAAAERLFGYREADIVDHNVSVLMPAPDRDSHDAYMAHYKRTGEKRIIGKARRVLGCRADGSTFPLELSVGEAIGGGQRLFTGFVRDLSLKEETEAKLQDLQSELLHVSRVSAMGTMASTLAHELNQPITAVANYMEAARDLLEARETDTEMLHEALSEAAAEALRAGSIVRRLREFVGRGEVDMRLESLDGVIDGAVTLGLAGARERGLEVVTRLASEADAAVVDRVQIQQVLVNLFRNAAEAIDGRDGGRITIATAVDGPMVKVTVDDNGPGISEAVASRLFDAFASTKSEGMGLGLSICRTIIEAHGGRIWAEPLPTGGTRFSFTLIRADTEAQHGQ